jgi:large subunit ribosomal protein L6e
MPAKGSVAAAKAPATTATSSPKKSGNHAPRNSLLTNGVHRRSRTASYVKSALYKKSKATVEKKADARPLTKTVEVGGAKNGESRVVPVRRPSRYYPTEDTPKPLANRKTPGTAKLRSSITPGTVLVVLSGRFRGKRVVFLKQLASGLLLVTGPFKINGVPLRRVNQAYVIATSVKVDLSSVNVPAKLNDAYFAKAKAGKKTKSEAEFFDKAEGSAAPKKVIAAERVADQKDIDKALVGAIKKTALLKEYLQAPFTLTKGQYPHALKF